jgi:hypothetical protein
MVLNQIPYPVFGTLGKQSWGWSHMVDVSNPKGNTISLSGSYVMSGHIAELFAIAFAALLENMGYKIKIGDITG